MKGLNLIKKTTLRVMVARLLTETRFSPHCLSSSPFTHQNSIVCAHIALLINVDQMSSTPSSRRRGHSSRNSQSSTPKQQAQATPRSTRQSVNGAAVASSSPLFFQSSPGRQTPAAPPISSSDGMIISSPPRNSSQVGDREATPRPTARPVDGITPIR